MKIFFLGWAAQYEKNFINYLSDNYGVEHLESPKGLRRLHRITRILGRPRRSILLGRVYCRMRKFDRTDLLICNEAMVGSRVNPEIIKAFPGKKVLLIRDLVGARFLEKWRADFDAVYSFDREQCARLGISYMDQFIPIGYRKFAVPADSEKATTEPAALFIGREKGRGATLREGRNNLQIFAGFYA
ncbi:hypothetical protein [Paraburkholderia caballeronis]|uniref:hypothetical protein n=1 Tax=Paraburkholderia caballeronis TaxID=416943 RepID=UPI001065651F|nr:hypothetical protein [Paraburkholderia caballeronis]